MTHTPVQTEPESVVVEAFKPDGMVSRFTLEPDGTVSSFTIERGVDAEAGIVGSPVTARWLRGFRFEETLAEAKAQSEWWSEVADDGTQADAIRATPSRRSGPRGYGEPHYADIARRYVLLLASRSVSPIADLAAEVHVSESTARNHVREARRLGLLGPTDQGKAGGRLTPKAIEILKEAGDQ